MTRIVLTEEQVRLLNPLEPVELCDPQGRVVASIPAAITPEELAQLQRAKERKGPSYAGTQVSQMLTTLEDRWQREGPFGPERLKEILAELRQAR